MPNREEQLVREESTFDRVPTVTVESWRHVSRLPGKKKHAERRRDECATAAAATGEASAAAAEASGAAEAGVAATSSDVSSGGTTA